MRRKLWTSESSRKLLINILCFCHNLAECVFIFAIIDNHYLCKTNKIYGNKPLSNPLSN